MASRPRFSRYIRLPPSRFSQYAKSGSLSLLLLLRSGEFHGREIRSRHPSSTAGFFDCEWYGAEIGPTR